MQQAIHTAPGHHLPRVKVPMIQQSADRGRALGLVSVDWPQEQRDGMTEVSVATQSQHGRESEATVTATEIN